MNPQNMITDKETFQKTAKSFFNIMFAEALRKRLR